MTASTSTAHSNKKLAGWCTTEAEEEVLKFVWNLKNFRVLQNEKEMRSSVFKGGHLSNHEWQMYINPKKKTDEEEYLAIYLQLKKIGNSTKKVEARFKFKLIDPNGGFKETSSMSGLQDFTNSSWGYPDFVKVSKISASSELNIKCKISLPGKIRLTEGASTDSPGQGRVSKLADNLCSMLNDQEFSDLVISTTTKKFNVHKIILAARSPVFRAMLRSRMTESIENELKILEFDDEIVGSMLEFIYSGNVTRLKEKAPDLLQIADKYELLDLKEDCERIIQSNLTVSNAPDILVLARLHNAKELKTAVMSFMKRYKHDVLKTEAFERLTKAPDSTAILTELFVATEDPPGKSCENGSGVRRGKKRTMPGSLRDDIEREVRRRLRNSPQGVLFQYNDNESEEDGSDHDHDDQAQDPQFSSDDDDE